MHVPGTIRESVELTTTDIRDWYHRDSLSFAHSDEVFQLCLRTCFAGQNMLVKIQNEFPRPSQSWHRIGLSISSRYELAKIRMQFIKSLESLLMLWTDPVMVEQNKSIRNDIAELAYYFEKRAFHKSSCIDGYRRACRLKHLLLKDGVCYTALMLSKIGLLQRNTTATIENYIIRTQGISQPWIPQMNNNYSRKRLPRKRKKGTQVLSAHAA